MFLVSTTLESRFTVGRAFVALATGVAQIMSAFEALDYLDDLPIEFIVSKE